jgi:positive regulator of sigma E activity
MDAMLGPLPPLHRALVVVLTLAAGLICGAWAAYDSPFSTAAAATLGALLGLAVAYAVVHDFHHRPQARHVRARRH